jgi:hypothetical protein
LQSWKYNFFAEKIDFWAGRMYFLAGRIDFTRKKKLFFGGKMYFRLRLLDLRENAALKVWSRRADITSTFSAS